LAATPFVTSSRFLVGALFATFFVCHADAQNAVEAAGAATAVSSATISAAKPPSMAIMPPTGTLAVSPHLTASSTPPPEGTNRIALAEKAGKDASKLLLRATLPESRIWIDGKPVGKTPVLLVVSPGKHQIEAVGPHAERMQCAVALLPHETRELTLKLESRYQARVTAH
jgi:hypothetical protein